MMTLQEFTPLEDTVSVSSHGINLDLQKAKMARRRRTEINKLKSSCQEHDNKNNVFDTSVINLETRPMCSASACRAHGVVSVMGRRREMEDTVRVEKGLVNVGLKEYDFFAVYDGHGGSHVAEVCRERIHEVLVEEVGDTWKDLVGWDWEKLIKRVFMRVDEEVCSGRKDDDMEEMTVGSTAVLAMVSDDVVVVGNCGDSRAILCRDGVAVPLSFDHKPDRPDELARIEAAGGRVINWNGYRVLGVLATSRSLGDHYLKPYVSSTPEITITTRTEGDEFLILASDGLWDVITNEVACNVVRRCLTGKIHRKSQEFTNGRCKTNSSRAEIAAALLVELAMAKGSKDNISVIVVELRRFSRYSCS